MIFRILNRTVSTGIILTCLCSCLRFTPSREDLSETDDKTQYAGEDAFYSLDKTQESRLNQLILDRTRGHSQSLTSSYKIGVDDIIELSVFDAKEIDRKVRVRPDGFISLPLIGAIKLAGFTESEAQQEITKQLEKFMHSPQVQLYISEYAAHKVWVVGNIPKPGAYPLSRDNYTLIELLSEAGGRNESASSTIILIPESEGQNKNLINSVAATSSTATAANVAPTTTTPPEDTTLNAKLTTTPQINEGQLLALANTDKSQYGIEIPFESLVGNVNSPPIKIPLKAGDTIVVPEAGTVEVDGEVHSPGSYSLPSKMTLLGAIATAKGLTYSANIEAIEVIRELGAGKKALITVDLQKLALKDGSDIRLRNGDIIRVPSETSRFITNQTVTILNGILGRINPTQF